MRGEDRTCGIDEKEKKDEDGLGCFPLFFFVTNVLLLVGKMFVPLLRSVVMESNSNDE